MPPGFFRQALSPGACGAGVRGYAARSGGAWELRAEGAKKAGGWLDPLPPARGVALPSLPKLHSFVEI